MATHNLNKNRITTLLILASIAIAGIITTQVIALYDSYQISQGQTYSKIVNELSQGVGEYKKLKADTLRSILKELVLEDAHLTTTVLHYYDGDEVAYGHGNDAEYPLPLKPADQPKFQKDPKKYLLAHMAGLDLEQLRAVSSMEDYPSQPDTDRVLRAANLIDHFDTVSMTRILKARFVKAGIPFNGEVGSHETSLEGSQKFQARLSKSNLKGYAIVIVQLLFTDVGDVLLEKIKVVTLKIEMPIAYTIKSMAVNIIASVSLLLFSAFCIIYLLYLFMKQKKLSDIKNDFISNISHELKTPIATVQAAVQGMQHFDILNNENKTRQYLNTAATELQRLSGMVNQILSVSVFESEQFVINPVVFDLKAAIGQIISSQQLLQPKQADITLNYAAPTEVTADKNYLTQAISNLVDNAIKYSGADARVTITCRSVDNGIAIEVQDNGPGIPKPYQPYIFQKFFRVPGVSINVRGHGLGLNFVQKIIEKHGGLVRLQKSDAGGTTFYLFLPQ